jgi:hypothetical protein
MAIVLDNLRIRAPLGIRFWDQVAGLLVADGLHAEAWPEDAPSRRVGAIRTPSGILAFRNLSGLRYHEWPDTPGGAGSPAQSRAFVVEVRDARGRYVTTAHRIELPLEETALYPAEPASLADDVATGVPMFPSAGRAPLPGVFSMRAELFDVSSEAPAAHAVVVATPVEQGSNPSEPFYGVADGEGRVVVMGAYPPVEVDLTGSPPAGAAALHDQTWAFSVSVRYAPTQAPVLAGAVTPDQRDIFQQSDATIFTSWPDSPPAGVEAIDATVRFGEELVLRSVTETHKGKLLVQPASSPP